MPYTKVPMNALVEGYENKANIFLADTASGRALKLSVTPQYIGPDFFTISTEAAPPNSLAVAEGAAYLSDGALIQINHLGHRQHVPRATDPTAGKSPKGFPGLRPQV